MKQLHCLINIQFFIDIVRVEYSIAIISME